MRKNSPKGYSFRAMSRQLGFASPNYLKLVIDGQRNIGKRVVQQIANGLGLDNLESEYFEYMILLERSKTDIDRNWLYSQIARLRSGKVVSANESNHYAFYENWYNPIVRELVLGKNAESINYSEIAELVSPSISEDEAQKSIELLTEKGLIEVDAEGNFCHGYPEMSAETESNADAVKKYHSDMIDFGKAAIDGFKREEREISSVTMRVSEEGYQKVQKRIKEFREEIIHIILEDEGTDRVSQLNFQLFPVSGVVKKED